MCIANVIAKLRRSPRVNEGKGGQETASGSKEMGEKHRGADQADKNQKRKRKECSGKR